MRGDITDLPAPAAAILRQLPGVARVEVLVAAARPTCRIVHLTDWHYVGKDIFIPALEEQVGTKLSPGQADRRYEALLLEVEPVQAEQAVILRRLAKHHGLKEVWCEGLTTGWPPRCPPTTITVPSAVVVSDRSFIGVNPHEL